MATDARTKQRPNDREFLLGILWAAWFLHSSHGEDTYAIELLHSTVSRNGMRQMRQLARDEDYRFRRGFWAEASR